MFKEGLTKKHYHLNSVDNVCCLRTSSFSTPAGTKAANNSGMIYFDDQITDDDNTTDVDDNTDDTVTTGSAINPAIKVTNKFPATNLVSLLKRVVLSM